MDVATLDSSSTLDQVQAAYDDNASYYEDNDITKCRQFITACRFLLRRIPKSSKHGEQSIDLNPELIRQELIDAQNWLKGKEGRNAGVKHLDLRGFRD